jgi:hypothetical protein
MYKSIILALLILTGINIEAQQIKKESIDSGGGVATATGIKIVHTIGETVVAEKDNGNLHVSEGFIGVEFASYLEVEDYMELVGVNAYPNPTTEILNITFSESQNYQIQVFDMLGKEVLQVETNNVSNYPLNVSNLQSATYVVLIKNIYSKQFKIFRVVKK